MKCCGYIIFIISKNKKNVTEKIIIDLLDFQRKNGTIRSGVKRP